MFARDASALVIAAPEESQAYAPRSLQSAAMSASPSTSPVPPESAPLSFSVGRVLGCASLLHSSSLPVDRGHLECRYKNGDHGQQYIFSKVFGQETNQQAYFASTAAPMVRSRQLSERKQIYGVLLLHAHEQPCM